MDTEFSILNALRGPAAILDQNGETTARNEPWKGKNIFSIWLDTVPDENNYFDYCRQAVKMGNDYALQLLLGNRREEKIFKPYFSQKKLWKTLSI